MQAATLVVEARVASQQAEQQPGGHLATSYTLGVYKVFKGQLPAGPLRVLTPGGTLGLLHEAVSDGVVLPTGQQGIFLLEPGPTGAYRLAAGPQGFIGYDAASGVATDPFGTYPAIEASLYPTLASLAGHAYQALQPAPALGVAAAARVARPAAQQALAATPTISSLAPLAVAAGASTSTNASQAGVLTISGAGFGASQGSGYVQFRNADNPGPDATPNYVRPQAGDYLSWGDNQVVVRVPSLSTSGNAAGTGLVRVVNGDGNLATSSQPLTVSYALSTVLPNSDPTHPYRVHLVGVENGGYTLHYSPSLPAAAQASFEAALGSWRDQAGANRSVGAATTTDATNRDNESIVRFDNLVDALPAGVLGRTYSYYSGCTMSGILTWVLMETDYVFSASANWNFGSGGPAASQYDFQSVALHELGHGLQLAHIISATGAMNYAIGNGQARRTLSADSDLAAARDMTTYGTAASSAERCNLASYAPSSTAAPLPVVLVAFGARYVPGQGTALSWTTASERQSAEFVVESQAGADEPWQAVLRQPAAGSSATTRQYAALDARPLAGTRYYRLRQLDQDGTGHYSATVAVQGLGAETLALAAYPNPATGQVHLSGPLAPGATARVRLLDALGRVARQTSGPADQATFDLPLAGLPAGLYVLEWDGGTGLNRQRLTVE
ncbi:T9SS type A sorting domain-containing protein [Hymenobacter sp. RP-2-7]|uniref:T9SS type A sorting domain-containing protein n=1 Tax=Hymenobacter polaris TaxID=2682546 RepID=A0A7Y0AAU6_9BACT|nr:T9SS type A sorting domain-containing protein [Hymenobacter polaris]NML63969.1 T9SS type A sorting domain-containing protein [Hymenobacter polaris]